MMGLLEEVMMNIPHLNFEVCFLSTKSKLNCVEPRSNGVLKAEHGRRIVVFLLFNLDFPCVCIVGCIQFLAHISGSSEVVSLGEFKTLGDERPRLETLDVWGRS